MGKNLSLSTREKISKSKTKVSIVHLTEALPDYLTSILDENGRYNTPPSVVGYCLFSGVSRSRFYELAQSDKRVSDILEELSMIQEEYALDMGFNSRNSIFSMFLLKSKHNYHDQPQQLTQNNYLNVNPDVLAEAIQISKGAKTKD